MPVWKSVLSRALKVEEESIFAEELQKWEEERLKAVDLQDGVVRGSERAGRCVHKDAEERVYEGPEMRRAFITYWIDTAVKTWRPWDERENVSSVDSDDITQSMCL